MSNIVMALAGNPNTGKTCIFNSLTGAKQHVGNWPGVTIEKKEGNIHYAGKFIKVVDLPGTYSLGAYSEDEVIAREFILNEKPDIVANVLDATNLNRNLYLTVQMLEMGANVLIALNMMDSAEKMNIDIDMEGLSSSLGVKIVPTVASKGQGIDEIIKIVTENSHFKSKTDFKIDYGSKVEKQIHSLIQQLKKYRDIYSKYPARWLAIKLLGNDENVLSEIQNSRRENQLMEYIQTSRNALEEELGVGLDSYIISKRYEFIRTLTEKYVVEGKKGIVSATDIIDKWATNKILGIPTFLAVMWLVFTFTFSVSEPFIEWIEQGFSVLGVWAGTTLSSIGVSEIFTSFVVDGIINGLGSVLEILPVIFTLFVAIAVLEDSGYMARVAYVMDGPMRSIGLHGKAFIPFLLGFGCNVPAIMSTRTLESKRDKLIAVLANPFISCSARLPVYILFTSIFFSKNRTLVIGSLYIIGILMSIVTVKLLGKILPESDDSFFIIELPPYRLPTFKGVLLYTWSKIHDFLKKVSTIILAAVIIAWLLSALPLSAEYASSESLIGQISSVIAPILKPAGFGTWQAAIALIFGVLAKEIVVSTLGVVYKGGTHGLSAVISQHFTPLSAYSFMVMSLLYAPCVATIGTIKNETKSTIWTIISVIYGLVVAWVLSVLVYQVGLRLGFV